jgi:hypothetical protein
MLNYIKVYIHLCWFYKVFPGVFIRSIHIFPYIYITHYSDIRDMGIEGKEGLGTLDIVV